MKCINEKEIFAVKADFPISINRKKLWDIELGILDDIDRVCKENGLQYFLHAGGGIGAARHQGFIPWDDDIDIGMLRSDFEKFLAIFHVVYKDKYCIQYGYGQYENCGTLLRIRDRNSTAIIKNQWHIKDMCHGVFVEIYPFDSVLPNENVEKRATKIRFLEKVMNHRFSRVKYSGIKGVIDSFLNIVIPTKVIWNAWNRECQRYNAVESGWIDTPSCPNYFLQGIHRYKREYIIPTISAPFEGKKYLIPSNNDAVLKIEYGDYMKLPPVEQRGMNHDRIVFFDPNTCYQNYLGSSIPDQYFAGEFDEII